MIRSLVLILLAMIVSCSSPSVVRQSSEFKETIGQYNRKDWHHWIDEDKDCQNTRAEILIKRSQTKVTLNKKGCVVKTGTWDDFYYDETLTNARLVDIDHVVPLKHAFVSGGANWPAPQKETFANDEDNLVITNRKYNRQKGPKTILEWSPVNKTYACRYMKKWFFIKDKYGLMISQEELRYKQDLSLLCSP